MKKKVFSIVAAVAVVAIAGVNYLQMNQSVELSDLALENVEALARGENIDGGTCWGTGAGGANQHCPGGHIICCWAHTHVYGEN